jgi:fructose-1,6-bisphosphatase/inositol monophosphatase family enzyme
VNEAPVASTESSSNPEPSTEVDKETQELIDEMLAEEQQAILQDEYDE